MYYTPTFQKSSKLNILAVAIFLVGLTASVWAQGNPPLPQGTPGAPGGQPMGKGPAGGPPGGPPGVPPGAPGSPGGPPIGAKAPAVPAGASAGQVAGGKLPGVTAGLPGVPGAPQTAGSKLAGGPTGVTPPSRNPNALRAPPSPSAAPSLSTGGGVLGTATER